MDMYYPILILQTAIIGFYAGIIVYIHIGVGFGVARSTIRAMPEPQDVGRVTRDSHASFLYISNLIRKPLSWEAWHICLPLITTRWG